MTCAVMAFSIGNVAQGFAADQAGHPAVGQLGEAGTLVFFEILNWKDRILVNNLGSGGGGGMIFRIKGRAGGCTVDSK